MQNKNSLMKYAEFKLKAKAGAQAVKYFIDRLVNNFCWQHDAKQLYSLCYFINTDPFFLRIHYYYYFIIIGSPH